MNPACPPSLILLDDDVSYVELMSQMLESNLDCAVTTFTRPLDALGALAVAPPAVIVTDYHMPQINGLEFIRLASAMVPDAAFVLISGHHLDDEEPQLNRLPRLKGRLTKPVSWRHLADEIIRVWPTHIAAPPLRARSKFTVQGSRL